MNRKRVATLANGICTLSLYLTGSLAIAQENPTSEAQASGLEASGPASPEPETMLTQAVSADVTTASGNEGQEAEPDEALTKSSNRLIEEIVVTAQKREENLQDVPISVQAFSAATLDAKGIEEPKALQLSVPGLQYNIFSGYSLIYIRGVGTDAYIPSADSSVATYIDGIYYPFGFGLASALGSVERIEVLKGPQGTLFGRNSTGGAINIITKQPGQTAETSITGTLERFDKQNVRIYTNVPLTDTFAVSVSGLDYTEDNFYKLSDASPRSSLPAETSRAFSVKAGWSPVDQFSGVIGYSYMNIKGSNALSIPASDIKLLGQAVGVTQAPDYETGEDGPVYIDNTARVLSGDFKINLDSLDMRLILGRQKIESPALADYDGSNQPLVTFETIGQFAKINTAEFQLLSNDGTWGADWLKSIAGVYFIDSTAGYDPLLFFAGPGLLQFLANPPATGPLSGVAASTAPLFSLLGSIPGIGELINTGVTLNIQGVLDTRSTAGFLQSTANITDELALTLGGRYQVEKRTLAKASSRVQEGDLLVPLPVDLQPGRSKNTSNFSPKAVLDYKFTDTSLLYASFAQGFKSGTYNIIAIYAPGQYIKPEKTTSYELGYKDTWLDGTLRFSSAIFQNKIDDLQVQTISLTSGGAVRFETAGGARIRGADFDVTWQALPDLLPGLVFTTGGAYLKGIYTDFTNGSGFDPITGLFTQGIDFTGNTTVRTPKFSGNAGLNYVIDLDSGSIEMAGEIYYNSGSYFSAQNTDAVRQSAYDVVNAHVSYFHSPWGVRLTAFAKNINNTKYYNAISDLDFDTAKLLAAPRTYGIRAQWDF